MKIGIIGLGLIGGSIFKDLKKLNYDVVAVSKSQDGENIYKDYDVLKDCDLVFVCSAMNKTLAILDELEKFLTPETVVTDVCSLKEFVTRKKYSYNFVPSHPMAGTENKGFKSSFEGLFKDAKWAVITEEFKNGYIKSSNNETESLTLLTNIITHLGATPIFTTAKQHDEAVAMISHMPMVVAQALFLSASENPLALELASSGFRDMTRLALSNEEMATDMVNMNSKNIETSILKLYKAIGELTNGDYPKIISEIKSKRLTMFQ